MVQNFPFPLIFDELFEAGLLAEIKAQGKVIQLNEGETLLDIGDTVRLFPIVTKGLIKVSRMDEQGKELLLYYIHANESCAMTFTCCMQQFPSEIKAEAETQVEYIGIPIQVMDEWLAKYPSWKSFVMKTIRQRFHELIHTIDQLAFQKLDERLLHYLKEKTAASGSKLINLSHEEIAQSLASSREVISRLLKRLENEGKLLLYRNQIKILKEL